MQRHEFKRTSTGIVIGGHYVRRPPQMSRDADFLQSAMLCPVPRTRRTVIEWCDENALRILAGFMVGSAVVGLIVRLRQTVG